MSSLEIVHSYQNNVLQSAAEIPEEPFSLDGHEKRYKKQNKNNPENK